MSCRLDGDGDRTWDDDRPLPSTSARNVPAVDAGAPPMTRVSDGTNTTLATATYHVGARIDPEPFDIVIRPVGTVDPDVLAAMQQAAARWERVVAGDWATFRSPTWAGSCGSGNACVRRGGRRPGGRHYR